MPPLVPSLRPRDLIASALEDEDVLDVGRLLDSSVGDDLGGNGLATAAPLIGGNQDTRLAIIHTIPQRLS